MHGLRHLPAIFCVAAVLRRFIHRTHTQLYPLGVTFHGVRWSELAWKASECGAASATNAWP